MAQLEGRALVPARKQGGSGTTIPLRMAGRWAEYLLDHFFISAAHRHRLGPSDGADKKPWADGDDASGATEENAGSDDIMASSCDVTSHVVKIEI